MAREQFYWGDPGVAYSGKPDVPAGGQSDDGKVLPPPHNFLLMLLILIPLIASIEFFRAIGGEGIRKVLLERNQG